MQEAIPMLRELRTFRQEECIEGQNRYLSFVRFYMTFRKRPDCLLTIRRALEDGEVTENMHTFCDLATIMSYLLEIQPKIEVEMPLMRQKYIEKAILCLRGQLTKQIAEKFLDIVGKLLSNDQWMELMSNTISLADTMTENTKEVVINLNILMKKIQWQLEKRQKWMVDNESFINSVWRMLEMFEQIKYLRKPSIILAKTQTLNKLLTFLLEHKDTSNHWKNIIDNKKNVITQEVCLYMKEENDENIELVMNSIRLYGIFNGQDLISFVKGGLNNMTCVEFSQMLRIFLIQAKTTKLLNRQSVLFLLEKVYRVMFDLPHNLGSSRKYLILKSLSDLAMTITTLFNIDMTKNIFKEIDNRSQSLEITFLSSMLMLHYFRLTQTDSTRAADKFLEQKSYYFRYEQFIKGYRLENMGDYDPRLNPQLQNDVVWQLLILRNSIIVNTNELQKGQYIEGILYKLIKYIVFDICPVQCKDIVMMLLDTFKWYDERQLFLPKIIDNVCKCQGGKMPSNRALECLEIILKTIFSEKKNCHAEILASISVMAIKIINQNRFDEPMFSSISNILKMCLTTNLVDDQLIFMKPHLINLLQKNMSPLLFDVYLDILYVVQKKPEMEAILLSNNEINSLLQEGRLTRIYWSQRQRYDILTYIIKNGKYDEDVVLNCWSILLQKSITHSYEFDFVLQSTRFFKHMREKCKAEKSQADYRIFLCDQIRYSVEAFFILIAQLGKNKLLTEVIKMFRMLKTMQVHLYDNLCEYEKVTDGGKLSLPKLIQLPRKVFDVLEDIKWSMNFNGGEIRSTFKNIWCECSLLQQVLSYTCERLTSMEPEFHSKRQNEVIQQFEKIKDKMDNTDKKQKKMQNQWFKILMIEMSKTVIGISYLPEIRIRG